MYRIRKRVTWHCPRSGIGMTPESRQCKCTSNGPKTPTMLMCNTICVDIGTFLTTSSTFTDRQEHRREVATGKFRQWSSEVYGTVARVREGISSNLGWWWCTPVPLALNPRCHLLETNAVRVAKLSSLQGPMRCKFCPWLRSKTFLLIILAMRANLHCSTSWYPLTSSFLIGFFSQCCVAYLVKRWISVIINCNHKASFEGLLGY